MCRGELEGGGGRVLKESSHKHKSPANTMTSLPLPTQILDGEQQQRNHALYPISVYSIFLEEDC